MKTKGKFGCVFILVSGVLFTVERYLSILMWSVMTTPVLTRGNGGYNESPQMPDLKTNYFVVLFLLLGFFFLLLEINDTNKKKIFGKTILTWASIFIIGALADCFIPGLGVTGVGLASILFIISLLYHMIHLESEKRNRLL